MYVYNDLISEPYQTVCIYVKVWNKFLTTSSIGATITRKVIGTKSYFKGHSFLSTYLAYTFSFHVLHPPSRKLGSPTFKEL